MVSVPDDSGIKVYFNPFTFSVEQNNEFLAKGYEVMPLSIPRSESVGEKDRSHDDHD